MKRFRADTNIGVERIIRKGRLHHWNCRNWSISPYILSHVNMVLTDCLYQSWSSLRWVVRSCQESPCGAKNASDVFLMEQRKSVWQFLKSTLIQWLEDRPFQLASSLSYYTIFSLAPLLVIVIAIAGFAFGEAAAEQRSRHYTGDDRRRQCPSGSNDDRKCKQAKTGIISAAIGFLALLLGAGGVWASSRHR